jgi:hypothetical protein
MDDADRVRLAREASAVKQAMATVAGDDPGPVPAPFVEGSAEAVLTEMLGRYEHLQGWIEQAVRLAEARAASQLASEVEGISPSVRRSLQDVESRERHRMQEARYPSADDPAGVLGAYATLAQLLGSVTPEPS